MKELGGITAAAGPVGAEAKVIGEITADSIPATVCRSKLFVVMPGLVHRHRHPRSSSRVERSGVSQAGPSAGADRPRGRSSPDRRSP